MDGRTNGQTYDIMDQFRSYVLYLPVPESIFVSMPLEKLRDDSFCGLTKRKNVT